MTELKAANYGAGAGQRIIGNLGRGSDGKFTAAGDDTDPKPGVPPVRDKSALRQALGLDPKAKKGKAGGKGKGAKPKPTDEQKAAEKQAKQDANRAKVAPDLGLSDDDSKSLAALAAGAEPGDTTELEKRGLVERGGDGAPRLTTSGNALNTALNRGDLGAAKRVASVAADRKKKADQTAAEKAKRDEEKARKQAEKDRKAGKIPAPAPAPVEAASMTALATAVQAAITDFLAKLTAAKAISADRADSLEEAGQLFVSHLEGMDEELVTDALKAGRRNSSRDQNTIQDIHDFAATLGADCAPAVKPPLKSLPAGMSYDQAREEIRQAIKEKYTPEPDTVIASSGELVAVDRDYYCWVVELYEDAAIYSDKGDDLYRVSYAFTSEGILLGEPVKVKRVTQYVPVGDHELKTDSPSPLVLATYEYDQVNKHWTPRYRTTDSTVYLPIEYTPSTEAPSNPYAVKSLGNDRIGGYAVLFGDATRTDLTGDYFTKSTDFWLNEIGPNRPMLYHHALDSATKADPVVGIWDTLRVDDIGVWTEGQLKKAHKYKQAIQQLVDAGVLGLSSGSAPNLVLKSRKQRANEITRWPILEVSLTPEPAEPRMTPVTAIKSYFADAGLDLPAALVDASDTPAPTAGAEAPTSAQSVDDRARRLNVELDLLELSLP